MIIHEFIENEKWGEKFYFIKVSSPYEMLYDLANGELSNSKGVEAVINNIKNAIRLKQQYVFGGSDYCLVVVNNERNSIIEYDFGDNEITIDTSEIINLLEDWHSFLVQKGR